MNLGLTGRLCLVTGASRGIGAASVRALAGEGAQLVLVSRGGGGVEGVEGRVVAADVTRPDTAPMLRRLCEEELGRTPDVLVNNAGTSSVRPLDELTDEEWQAQWELNVMAPMRLMRELGPPMAERGWGRIVNVSSSSGKRPSATNAAYSVAKAAQLSLSRAYADAYAARGVLVNAVTPGVVATELWTAEGGMADQVAAAQGSTREEVLEQTGAKPPLGRFGTAEEISAVICFLCSELASNVTGAAWSVDGGTVPVLL